MAGLDRRTGGAVAMLMALAACASSPPSAPKQTLAQPLPVVQITPAKVADGPPVTPIIVQAEPTPVAEALIPAANQPYVVDKQTIVPDTRVQPYSAKGVASWYGTRFNGRRTSSGERYNMAAFTVAHRTLPIPCYVRITNLRNGKSVIARVNDRGPYTRNRLVDVSYATADKLGFVKDGKTEVLIERVFPGDAANGNLASSGPTPAANTGPTTATSGGTDNATATDPKSAPIASPPSNTSANPAGKPLYWQVAAFRDPDAAARYRDTMVRTANIDAGQVAVINNNSMCRVLVGPYHDSAEAETARQWLTDRLSINPVRSDGE